MGTTLTGTTPQDTYDSLIKVTDNGPLSGTAKYLSDGLGNDSALALSTAGVGIGTNAPAERLEVAGSNVMVRINAAVNSFAQLGFYEAGALKWNTYNDFNNDNYSIGNSGGTHLSITSAGRVGIGTSSPSGILSVVDSYHSTFWRNNNFGTSLLLSADAGSDQRSWQFQSRFLAVNRVDLAVLRSTNGTTYGSSPTGLSYQEVARFTENGITFNGDTAAANALDDYEEGTFAPAVIGTTTAGTANYYQQFGRYTKIGRTVNFQLFLAYDTGTGTGNLRISGLPFTATSDNVNNALAIGYFDVVSLTASHVATAWIENGTTQLGIYQYPVGGGAAAVVPYDAAANISISGTYIV